MKKSLFKKMVGVVLLVVLLVIALPVAALAADPPDVTTITWNGSGLVTGSVNATGDQLYTFGTSAAAIQGSFTVTNLLDNPYGYGVNSSNAQFVASVSGGSAFLGTERLGSYPMYGAAGQETYSFISASGGSASMAMYTYGNYAAMGEANYGHVWTSDGNTFSADADSFQIIHQVTDSAGDYAYINALGSGSADVDCMSSDLGAGSLTFGKGAGCYTDASYNGTGDQTIQFYAYGSSSISQFGSTLTGDGTLGSVSLGVIANFVGTLSVPDFSASVN